MDEQPQLHLPLTYVEFYTWQRILAGRCGDCCFVTKAENSTHWGTTCHFELLDRDMQSCDMCDMCDIHAEVLSDLILLAVPTGDGLALN